MRHYITVFALFEQTTAIEQEQNVTELSARGFAMRAFSRFVRRAAAAADGNPGIAGLLLVLYDEMHGGKNPRGDKGDGYSVRDHKNLHIIFPKKTRADDGFSARDIMSHHAEKQPDRLPQNAICTFLKTST